MFTKEKIIEENQQHRTDVQDGLTIVFQILSHLGANHDLDKNIPEYAEILADALNTKDFSIWEKIHLEKQRHHSECLLQEGNPNLIDLIELVVDGLVAAKRRTPGFEPTLQSEVDFFISKGWEEPVAKILANTFILLNKAIVLEEEETILDQLLEKEAFSKNIWDCTCKSGKFSEVFKKRNCFVRASDLNLKDYPDSQKIEFTRFHSKFKGDIFMTPELEEAESFISHALDTIEDGCKVASLMKLSFLRNQKFMETCPPKKIFISNSKEKGYAWFVWEKGICQFPETDYLD